MGDTWTSKTDMPIPARSNGGSAALGTDTGYYFGGSSPFAGSDNDEYSQLGNSWTDRQDLLAAYMAMGSANVGTNEGYIFGGFDAVFSYTQNNDEYSKSGDSWTSKPDMPTPPRVAARAFTLNSKYFSIGGSEPGGLLADNDEYNPSTEGWTGRTDLPSPARDFIQTFSLGTNLGYAVGGDELADDSVDDNDEYSESGDSWTTRTVIPTARHSGTAGTIDDARAVVTCGLEDTTYSNDTEEYSRLTDSWTTRADALQSLSSVVGAMLSSNPNLYQFGGYTGLAHTQNNDEYAPVLMSDSEFEAMLPGASTTYHEQISYVAGSMVSRIEYSGYLAAAVISYTRGDASTLPSYDTDLETLFTESDYTDVADDDGVYVALTPSYLEPYAIFLWKDRNTNNTDGITATCRVKAALAPSSSTVYLQIYNRNSSSWETLDTNNIAAADIEFILTGTQTTNLSYYYDSSYWVACRIYQDTG